MLCFNFTLQFSKKNIINVIKRSHNNSNKKVIEKEAKKVDDILFYIQKFILEENTTNRNLLSFQSLYNEENDLKKYHLNLIKISYLLKNACINEQKWLLIYEKIGNLYLLDEQTFNGKKKIDNLKTGFKNNTLNKENIIIEDYNFCNNNLIEKKICQEYNLFNLKSCYTFVFKTCIDNILNYLPLYTINNYILILKCCENFYNFFFKIHKKKSINKLNFIYLYSCYSNYESNIKILKNKNDIIKNEGKLNLNYYYQELFNLKYHQILIYKIKLTTKILDDINYNLIDDKNFVQLSNIFYTQTKNGLINEKNVLKFLDYYIEKFKDNLIKYNVDIFFKIINIMYYSKIINYNIILYLVNTFKKVNSSVFCKKKLFENYLKLLKLLNLKEDNFFIYNYCKYYIFNNIAQINLSNFYNFFFVSSIIGIFDISLINLYISFLKKNKINLKESLKHKIYYTLLGWDIILKKFIDKMTEKKKEKIEIILLNYKNKDIHYFYSTKLCNNYSRLSFEINQLMNFYKNKIFIQENKKINVNYCFNQYNILTILKKHFTNVIYEYVTNQKISLDVFLKIYRNNYYKNIAIEFNGRTHYNLLIKKNNNNEISYNMIENHNTIYKKWLLSNFHFSIISISYYEWNKLNEEEKERYLINTIHFLK
ncbi:RAP protein, putative [Plasmodium gallinaceum]|uniref:RAP protein, putative n=1 Tax=Plasmodium gallinaceum TaxID=5849 RepID=A0A1J1GLE8_PLAGA|nr:RAP protein, putative [Plasmodium gallinaceum]CRG93029.1 RAP protein, putative [Plasmodium gallinaceum]